MLKKLVKYGNSNALVLDKAIMELVGIEEGSVLKIKTDGTSLILTPHVPVTTEKVNEPFTAEKAMMEVNAKFVARGDVKLEQKILKGQHRVRELSEKLAKDPAYLADLKAIVEKRSEMEPEMFLAHLKNLQYQYQPELKQAEVDMCLMPSVDTIEQQKAMQEAGAAYGSVHMKYQSTVMPKIMALGDNPEYQHELQLLVEEYQANLNSQEYMLAVSQLNCKYCPEFAEYSAEIAKVSENLKPVFEANLSDVTKR